MKWKNEQHTFFFAIQKASDWKNTEIHSFTTNNYDFNSSNKWHPALDLFGAFNIIFSISFHSIQN